MYHGDCFTHLWNKVRERHFTDWNEGLLTNMQKCFCVCFHMCALCMYGFVAHAGASLCLSLIASSFIPQRQTKVWTSHLLLQAQAGNQNNLSIMDSIIMFCCSHVTHNISTEPHRER